MTIVTAKDFHANSRYMRMARRGEHLLVRSRGGLYRITYEPTVSKPQEQESKRDLNAEICQAMKDWKEYLNGDESKMLSWEEFLDAVQDHL